ncbi:peptidoglycan DD-metalloendopeptidase family protein, partial [candidate division KSB1 bacterium]|nr:peptidoglycan DD-metalloendopeptidase family protein [candidate division KSB1 bacterium]
AAILFLIVSAVSIPLRKRSATLHFIVLPMSLLDNYTMEQSSQTNAEWDADGRRKCIDLSTTNSEHIHAVIAHEMAHIKRLDDLWIVLQNFIQAAYFFHPAIWLTNHRIYIARECICDSIVLAQDRLSRRAYCRGLISALKSSLRGLKGAGVFAAFASAHKVVKIRILHIKKGEKMKIPFSTKILFICIAVFILPMASQSKRTVHVANSSMTATYESLAFFNPLTGGEYKITSTYGERKHPISGERVFHRGVDLAAKAGTPVYAAAAGVITAAVTVVEQDNRMGKYVEVQHDNGYMTRYTQLRDITVQAGKTVKSGEKIGEVGSTGVSTGPHLHFELWKEGEHVNPADYIDF